MKFSGRYWALLGVIGTLFFSACSDLFVEDDSRASSSWKSSKYPLVQDIINKNLDKAISAVSDTEARSAVPDSRYNLLRNTLMEARSGNQSTIRAVDPEFPGISEEQNQKISELVEGSPELSNLFESLEKDLEQEFAKIPPIEIEVQPLDDNGNPEGNPYTIVSQDGLINLGYEIITKEEFLLRIQSGYYDSKRAFIAGDNYERGSQQFWPNGIVTYYLDNSLSSEQKRWIKKRMTAIDSVTGMKFREQRSTAWEDFWHKANLSGTLKIATAPLDDALGRASVGRITSPTLTMDSKTFGRSNQTIRNRKTFDHEMGHVFGLLHEHQRYDRDDYLNVTSTDSAHAKIGKNNEYRFLFFRWHRSNADTLGTPFDYQSAMMYDNRSYIKLKVDNKVVPRRHGWLVHNFYTYYSPWDVQIIKRKYGISPNPTPTYTPAPYGNNRVVWPK